MGVPTGRGGEGTSNKPEKEPQERVSQVVGTNTWASERNVTGKTVVRLR